MDKEVVVRIHSGILLSHKKESTSLELMQMNLESVKQIKKLWYVHTMEYYSAIKSNKMRGMNLEPVKQSKVSQKEKISYFNAYIQNLENGTDEPICRTGI